MKNFTSIIPESIDQKKLHQHLLTAIAPRPICLASTVDKKGQVNLSPFSFFNVFSSNPPIMIFSPSRRGRDNSTKDTYNNIVDVQEVVINVVNYSMVEQMSLTSTEYPKEVDEFIKSGLTPVASKRVLPPRVEEAPAAFECKVNQVIPLGQGPGAGNLVLAEVVLMHFQTALLGVDGLLNTQQLDVVARMGGNWYTRVSPSSLFEIEKPSLAKGIGVDQLPTSVLFSKVLTGNDLGRLANLDGLPSASECKSIASLAEVREIQSEVNTTERMLERLHQLAQSFLEKKQNRMALKVVCYAELLNSS